jgi:hypothetical protein
MFAATDIALDDLGCVLRSARGINCNNSRQRAQPIEPAVEHSQRSGPAEAVDADNGNQITCEHGARVGARRQFMQML